jgi:coenzyme F420-reducing hydrogenase beta subunit
MPAIASLEDLKAAQKEGLSIYAMLSALCDILTIYGLRLTVISLRHAPCSMRYLLGCGYRNAPQNN